MSSTAGPESGETGGWQARAASLKQSVDALYLAGRDPRVPLAAKVIIALTVAYALSPIDLIPDAIPVIGYLDDLILVPVGIWLALRLIPEPIWQECQRQAREHPLNLKENRTAAIVIVLVWIIFAALLTIWLYRLFAGEST